MLPEAIRVLFVCYANICRSPMAEAVFNARVNEAGLTGKIVADSAGVSYLAAGEETHPQTLALLKRHNIDLVHRARRITSVDLNEFQHVLAMDGAVLRSIWGMGKGSARVESLMKYAPGASYSDIPDPMRTNDFELVHELVTLSTTALLVALRAEYDL